MNLNVSSTFISSIIKNCSLPKYILIQYTNCVIETEILVSSKIYIMNCWPTIETCSKTCASLLLVSPVLYNRKLTSINSKV